MNKAGKITSISPAFAVAGGEIAVECVGFQGDIDGEQGCFVDGVSCRITAASPRRILATMPEDVFGSVHVHLESGSDRSDAFEMTVGENLTGEMHFVANPAVDPKDDSIVMTRSGSRGQTLPFTLYRLEKDGYVDEMPAEIMNPTGIAFAPDGSLYVTNRAEGEVCRIDRGEDVLPYATGLGVATGLAFDDDGVMYVGDRSGTIYRVPEFGTVERFASLEPSVSAYHIAFGPDGKLYVSTPGLASHDSIHAVDEEGNVENYIRGFGRPQGLAFDTDGNLFVAACYKGKHGIVRIAAGTKEIEMFAAGNNIVGLCFTRAGELIVATNDSIYSLAVGIRGTLLD